MVYSAAKLDAVFGALADPTRRAILSRLAMGDRSISELASRFDMSLPAVSKHIRVLEHAGLARVQREGRVRRTRLKAAPMREALEWIERYRQFWEFQLDQLAAYLEHTSSPENPEWPQESPSPRSARPRSKSGARSARRSSASSTRGRRQKK